MQNNTVTNFVYNTVGYSNIYTILTLNVHVLLRWNTQVKSSKYTITCASGERLLLQSTLKRYKGILNELTDLIKIN
jgi:hypothetical protein